MIISVVNLSKSVSDPELQTVIRAVNRQVQGDFEPYWGIGATLRLEGRAGNRPDRITLPELRGDAVLYLWDEIDVEDALGYHDRNARGIPFGVVFTNLSARLKEPWSVTLSHEALELVADPQVNLLVAGPHPAEDREVFHWYEMSDAVQAQHYQIDGIDVSNFVLPLYFTPDAEVGSRNDFLGTLGDGGPLLSFGINPGGYIGFFDQSVGEHVTFARQGDELAKSRLMIKKAATVSRRAYRIGGWPREKALIETPAEAVATPSGSTRAARSPQLKPVMKSLCVSQGLRVDRID